MTDNHILPFLWMRGEAEQVLRNELAKSTRPEYAPSVWRPGPTQIMLGSSGGTMWTSSLTRPKSMA